MMSASDALSSRQFSEVSARDYFGKPPDETGSYPVRRFTEQFQPGEDESWEQAASRIRGTSRYQALVDHPERMRNPVVVHNTWVANGHHRVVRAMDTGQSLSYEHYRDADVGV